MSTLKELYREVSVHELCSLFGFSRQAYYDYQQREQTRQMHQHLILSEVKAIRKSLPRIGSLKLHYMLSRDEAFSSMLMGRDSFCRLLRDNDLTIPKKKRYYPKTTDSRHPYRKYPDLSSTLVLKEPGCLWVSDITYIRTERGFCYLSLITDAWSRKIVGHHLSQSLGVRGCLYSLDKAIATLSEDQRPVHHSDRGIQYCCDAYVGRLKQRGIAVSMTQNGSAYENAMAERVNGILKGELGLGETFKSYSHALQAVSRAIGLYNHKRPHLSLDMLTPHQAHQGLGQQQSKQAGRLQASL